MGEIFESEEMESIEHIVKMIIFGSISGPYWSKLVVMGSKIGQFDTRWNLRIRKNGIDWT